MKIIIFLIILTVVSCEKNDEDDYYWGECTALKNNSNWNAKIRVARNTFNKDYIDIIIDRFNEKGFHRDGLSFERIAPNAGKYELIYSSVSIHDTLKCTYSTSVDDGHVSGDRYKLITNDSITDYIEITKIEGDQIYGEFEVSLEKDTSVYKEEDFSTPFTIILRNGRFHSRISK